MKAAAKFSIHPFFPVAILLLALGCTKEPSFVEKEKPEVVLNGADGRLSAQLIHLSGDTVYILAANLARFAGQSLEIDAGTLIKVQDRLSITILPEATIIINGTAEKPVVFTSTANQGGAGIGGGGISSSIGSHFWYGIRIYGNAQTQPALSSGSIEYMRIEFAGGNETPTFTSFLLQDVTESTTIENVQVSYSFSTPSFEFNGGNCNARNLISYASSSSDFYIRNKYTGKLQHLLAWRHPYFPSSPGFVPGHTLAGVLLEDDGTFPSISNLSVVGPGLTAQTSFTYTNAGPRIAALVMRMAARCRIRNSVLMGFPRTAFYLDDATSGTSLANGESEFMYSIVQSEDSLAVFYLPPGVFPPFTSTDFKNYMMEPSFSNELFAHTGDFNLTDAADFDNEPNPLPASGSPVLTGADFSGFFNDPFFEQVSYRGAAGADNWLNGWTNFKPLQTVYNK